MKNVQLLIFLFTIFYIPLQSQNTINIPGDYPTIQQGINAANNGDLVLVADGTYTENINFNGKAITVASHFIQNGNKSHIENTIIDGSNPSHPDTGSVVLFISGEDTTSVLYGFKITGGTGIQGSPTARAGGGISIYASGAKICYNIIEFNSVNNVGNYAVGGGIYVGYSNTTFISNNVIRNNSVDGTYPFGGGISLVYSGLTHIFSNKIMYNEAIGTYASGGGIDAFYNQGETVINSNYLKSNDAVLPGYGGGGIDLYNWGANVTISNNLIVDNSARWGGGILVDYDLETSSKSKDQKLLAEYPQEIPFILNNTIINNYGMVVGGIYGRGFNPDVMNNIVWGNTYNSGGQIFGANVTYSDVEGGYPGDGNMDVNPEFADSLYFCLCDTSGCIDMGNPDPIFNDVEDPNNPGYALFPALGILRNDMGAFGGSHSTWSSIILDTLRVPTDYATIQEAIDAAMNGNVVLVAEGTYYENINFRGKAITVASHFLVDGNESHIENTIIDGSQPIYPDSASVVTFRSGEDTTSIICGFTITGGTGTRILNNGYLKRVGGGVFAHTSGAKIQNNIIESNSIQNNSDSWGGGICCFNGDYVIENNTIKNNEINSPVINFYSLGGGIYTYSLGYVRIANNKIVDNIITAPEAWGGGIIPAGLNNDNYFILNNLISGNTLNVSTGGSGGIDIYNHSPKIENNIIVNNSAPRGGGAVVENAIPLLSSNTIAYNTSTISGGGLDIVNSNPLIMNSILWGNNAPTGPQISGLATVVYSDVEGGWTGEGNINDDPLFVNPTNGDYTLQNNVSPCLQTGIDSIYIGSTMYYCPPFCIHNVPRPSPAGTRPDIGACENENPVGINDDLLLIPEEYSLEQNYPNPFNPSTKIKYGIPERTFVELRIYDILGREVKRLVNEEQDAGYYEINFSAASLASGIYIFQLKAGNFVETKKMILMK